MADQDKWAGGPELHAVVSTGKESAPLVGPTRRTREGSVPILELRDELVKKVSDAQRDLLDPERKTVLLTRELVYMHTPAHLVHGNPDVIIHTIGGSTLDEAAKECIGAFEASFSDQPPTWVASTHALLAEIISDHYYDIPIKSLDEELTV